MAVSAPKVVRRRAQSRPVKPDKAARTAVELPPLSGARQKELLDKLRALSRGDFATRIHWKGGLEGEIASAFNQAAGLNRGLSRELVRVGRTVGREGRVGARAALPGATGAWKTTIDAYNGLIGDMVQPTTEIARVLKAVAQGDLSQKIPLEIGGRLIRGDFWRIGKIVNTMVDQLRSFAAEVTRVAKEVGMEGKLGGQARVKGMSGTWKDLTDNVNQLAGNLTNQVRNIALVTTAVANGDLSQKITVDARGEILELKSTINVMVDQLRSFAAEVTRVAKEVGVEGKLGGQARVPGVAGTWKNLTENVNQLAGNLTAQVRAIAEVSTAVTRGNLTRLITVEAQGEVLALKDNINQMIGNLRETTEKNMEQDWLKTNLARFSAMMQGQKNLEAVSRLIMSELTPLISAQHGAFFLVELHNGDRTLELIASYAYRKHRTVATRFRFGEGLIGQCATDRKPILLHKVPGNYIRVASGLGEGMPVDVLVLPVLFEGEVLAVIELASFQAFSQIHRIFLDQLMVSIGVVLNIISASMRTEELLQELQNSNAELEAQAKELEEKAKLLQIKNQEVELASLSLEDKAEQLALISKYKSEFLANMSHELRTPLNSLLIMAKLLTDNKDATLNPKQVEFASTIYASGRDLLSLINEILDLSKVEAGKMNVVPTNVSLREVADYVERDFRPVAQQKGIDLILDIEPGLPHALYTDGQRLQQILKNLLSNAFKFTSQGFVSLSIHAVPDVGAERFGNEKLHRAERVIRFSVQDTGIGIAESKQKLIFEAFQQVDATTSRRYGGTGLGLTISREISRLLGGEIRVTSEPGHGSTFSLYVPHPYVGADLRDEVVGFESQAVSFGPEPFDAEHRESGEVIEFDGEKVLVVDDDVRNIFAITSILENRRLKVTFAENGLDAIHALEQDPDIRLVLMDVMMPEMDGYETTRAIRRVNKFAALPIIALTAKAMKGDREKCLEAGVSEYIAKPVDVDRLLLMIRDYLQQSRVTA